MDFINGLNHWTPKIAFMSTILPTSLFPGAISWSPKHLFPKSKNQTWFFFTKLDQEVFQSSPGSVIIVSLRGTHSEIDASIIGQHLAYNSLTYCDWLKFLWQPFCDWQPLIPSHCSQKSHSDHRFNQVRDHGLNALNQWWFRRTGIEKKVEHLELQT